MKKSIILVSALFVMAMVLVSCASEHQMTNASTTTHQTNRATYELPLGRTYDPQ